MIIPLAILLLVGIYFLLTKGDTVDYVATVDSEIAGLEVELMELDAAVQAGELTAEEAAVVYDRIVARVDSITTAAKQATSATLTESQKMMLANGLDRLKNILTTYQSTLLAVEESVATLPEVQQPMLKRGGGSGNRSSLAQSLIDSAIAVEETVAEVAEEYVDQESVEEVSEELASSTDALLDKIEEKLETSSSTEDVGDDESTQDDEVTDETPTDDTESVNETGAGEPEEETIDEEEGL